MNSQFAAIKNRLLLDQALSPEQAALLAASPELREFKDALDLALFRQPDAAGPEPNELIDARILGHARERSGRRSADGGGATLLRFGIWHWVAGAMAACLVVAVTHMVWQQVQDQPEPSPTVVQNPPAAADGIAPAAPGDMRPMAPADRSASAMSWDAISLEQEMFALQSTLVVDLARESESLAIADMLGGI